MSLLVDWRTEERLTRSRWGQAGFVWSSSCALKGRCSSHLRKLEYLFVVWSCLVCTHHPHLNYLLQDAVSVALTSYAIDAVISESLRFPAKFSFINIAKDKSIRNKTHAHFSRWSRESDEKKKSSWIFQILHTLATQVGQNQSPSGTCMTFGLRQNMWHPRSQPSHKSRYSSSSPLRHTWHVCGHI